MRLRNDTGGVLHAIALGLSVGPGEEFEHDTERLGIVPGCVPAEPPDDLPDSGDGSLAGDEDPPAKPSKAKAAVAKKEAGE